MGHTKEADANIGSRPNGSYIIVLFTLYCIETRVVSLRCISGVIPRYFSSEFPVWWCFHGRPSGWQCRPLEGCSSMGLRQGTWPLSPTHRVTILQVCCRWWRHLILLIQANDIQPAELRCGSSQSLSLNTFRRCSLFCQVVNECQDGSSFC